MDVGLTADIGSLARLPKITGNESLLRELAFTARTFNAEEAQKLGLVSKVVPGSKDEVLGEILVFSACLLCERYLGSLPAEALKLAKKIASKSPIATVGTKHILVHSRDHRYYWPRSDPFQRDILIQTHSPSSVSQNLEYVATWNQVMLQSDVSHCVLCCNCGTESVLQDVKDSITSFTSKKAPVYKSIPKL